MKIGLIIFSLLLSGASYFMYNSSSDMSSSNGSLKNVKGEALETCCTDPMTGFYRNGRCETGPEDYGTHVVCAEMTEEFLTYTKGQGNDLSTPRPEYRFPGLKPGDKWCLCALRWREAHEAGVAPPVVLASTHEKTLQFIGLDILKEYTK